MLHPQVQDSYCKRWPSLIVTMGIICRRPLRSHCDKSWEKKVLWKRGVGREPWTVDREPCCILCYNMRHYWSSGVHREQGVNSNETNFLFVKPLVYCVWRANKTKLFCMEEDATLLNLWCTDPLSSRDFCMWVQYILRVNGYYISMLLLLL